VNEVILNIVDFLDFFTVILVDSITYLHKYASGESYFPTSHFQVIVLHKLTETSRYCC